MTSCRHLALADSIISSLLQIVSTNFECNLHPAWHKTCFGRGVMIRLLLVDDETDFANNIAGYLNSFPGEFEITSAFDAENAERMIGEKMFDVLLTDLRLPGRDGLDLVRHSTATQPRLRTLVMTAYGSPEHHRRALADGALQFVQKPVDLDELRDLLHTTYIVGKSYSDRLKGIDVLNATQHLAALSVTSGLLIRSGEQQGQLDFCRGALKSACTGDLFGPKAFYSMAVWQKADVVQILRPQECTRSPNIDLPTKQLVMAAAGRRNGNGGSHAEHAARKSQLSSLFHGKHSSDHKPHKSQLGVRDKATAKIR